MTSKQHTVDTADEGIRLDRWFKRHYPGMPHALLEKSLRKGSIRINGKKAKSSDRLEVGQAIEFDPQDAGFEAKEKQPKGLTPDDIRMMQQAVLYKDASIIIINKPFGIAVQGGSKITRSIDGMLGALAFDTERPRLVHRLDRDTSGVLVLARTSKAATQLMKLFASRGIDKTYWALVNGVPQPLQGTIDLPLQKKDNPKASGYPGGPEGRDYEVVQVDDDGQKAITEYRVVEALARRFALLELKPLTGRMHQLRVHMQAINCPIVGDHKYGGSMNDAEKIGVQNVLHLHARRIVIPALPNGKKIDITAPLPTHMRQSFEALGLDVPKK